MQEKSEKIYHQKMKYQICDWKQLCEFVIRGANPRYHKGVSLVRHSLVL